MRPITSLFAIICLLGLSATRISATVIYRDNDAEAIVIDDSADAPDLTELELIPENSSEEGDKCETLDGIRGVCQTLDECYPYFRYIDNLDLVKTGLLEFVENATRPCEPGKSDHICCGDRVVPFAKIRPKLPSRFLEPTTRSPSFEIEEQAPVEECGNVSSNPHKAHGGRPVIQREFPYVTALLKHNEQFCSGSLVASRWILTAAHCVNDIQDLAILSVNIGEHDLSNPMDHISRGVDKILYHSSFTMKSLNHDIALLRLREPVPLSEMAYPICLNAEERPSFPTPFVLGWGRTGGGRPQSTILQAVSMRILNATKCKEKFESEPPLKEEMFCATAGIGGQPDLADGCLSDSGSPLSFYDLERKKAFQIGLVSLGIGCGKKPGIYTRIDKYHNWITKIIQSPNLITKQ